MQSVLLSIRPKYAKQIVSGEKTVEIRKRFPVNIPDTVNLFIACNCERTMQEKRFEVGRNGSFLSLLVENIEMVVSDWNRRNAE